MARAEQKTRFSPLSELSIGREPGKALVSSLGAQWTSVLLQTMQGPAEAAAFETLPTPDQVIVMVRKGDFEIESFSARSWKRASYYVGSGGMTAPLRTSRLRWSSPQERPQTLHLYLPTVFFAEAREEMKQSASLSTNMFPDVLGFSDPVVTAMTEALLKGVELGMPDLYAESAASFLAAHLLLKPARQVDIARTRSFSGSADRRLVRALDFIKNHFLEPITLDRMGREGGISRYHFVRLFRSTLGITPHQHVIGLRMDHASNLLATTDLSILEVANACGYTFAAHFASAFQARFNATPSAYRRKRRR